MAQTNKKYYDELNIFRAFIIAWVVIGHSFDDGNTFLGMLHSYAYTFHMEAFFVLSGFLFANKIKRCVDIKTRCTIALGRVKRLIVPYLFFTAVSYILKIFFESYANNKLSSNIFVDILLGQNNPNGGLWFLYVLFLISLVAIIFSAVNEYIMLGVFAVLYIVDLFVNISIFPIDTLMLYGVFFYAGVAIKNGYDVVSVKLTSAKSSVLGILSIIMLAISGGVFYISKVLLQSKVLDIALCVFNIATWYILSVAINKNAFCKKPAMVVGEYGMDIYMIGYYVQIAIRVVLGSMLGVPYVVYSILMCVFGLVLPIPLSKYIVRKLSVTRALCLGDFKKHKKD